MVMGSSLLSSSLSDPELDSLSDPSELDPELDDELSTDIRLVECREALKIQCNEYTVITVSMLRRKLYRQHFTVEFLHIL